MFLPGLNSLSVEDRYLLWINSGLFADIITITPLEYFTISDIYSDYLQSNKCAVLSDDRTRYKCKGLRDWLANQFIAM